jgi:hypothetical protein
VGPAFRASGDPGSTVRSADFLRKKARTTLRQADQEVVIAGGRLKAFVNYLHERTWTRAREETTILITEQSGNCRDNNHWRM